MTIIHFTFSAARPRFFNIICKFTHNMAMQYVVVVIVCMSLQFICVLIAPLDLSLTGHFSLRRRFLAIDVRLMGLRVLRLRVRPLEDRFKVTVNGKRLRRPKRLRIDVPAALKALSPLKTETNIGIVAGEDAHIAAMVTAALEVARQVFGYACRLKAACYTGEGVEADGRVKLRLSILRVAACALAAIG